MYMYTLMTKEIIIIIVAAVAEVTAVAAMAVAAVAEVTAVAAMAVAAVAEQLHQWQWQQ